MQVQNNTGLLQALARLTQQSAAAAEPARAPSPTRPALGQAQVARQAAQRNAQDRPAPVSLPATDRSGVARADSASEIARNAPRGSIINIVV